MNEVSMSGADRLTSLKIYGPGIATFLLLCGAYCYFPINAQATAMCVIVAALTGVAVSGWAYATIAGEAGTAKAIGTVITILLVIGVVRAYYGWQGWPSPKKQPRSASSSTTRPLISDENRTDLDRQAAKELLQLAEARARKVGWQVYSPFSGVTVEKCPVGFIKLIGDPFRDGPLTYAPLSLAGLGGGTVTVEFGKHSSSPVSFGSLEAYLGEESRLSDAPVRLTIPESAGAPLMWRCGATTHKVGTMPVTARVSMPGDRAEYLHLKGVGMKAGQRISGLVLPSKKVSSALYLDVRDMSNEPLLRGPFPRLFIQKDGDGATSEELPWETLSPKGYVLELRSPSLVVPEEGGIITIEAPKTPLILYATIRVG